MSKNIVVSYWLEVLYSSSDREIPHYSLGALREAGVSCKYCLQLPCITESEGKAAFLSAHGAPRPQNIVKRYKDYKEFYRMLKRAGLWENSLYLERKHEGRSFPTALWLMCGRGGQILLTCHTRDMCQLCN